MIQSLAALALPKRPGVARKPGDWQTYDEIEPVWLE